VEQAAAHAEALEQRREAILGHDLILLDDLS
jgi:hypothetical protein